jgi:hypothetical protein
MNAVLTEDGKIALPPRLRENAQLQPGDTLDEMMKLLPERLTGGIDIDKGTRNPLLCSRFGYGKRSSTRPKSVNSERPTLALNPQTPTPSRHHRSIEPGP